MGPRNVRGVPNRARVRDADFAAGSFGGAPYGASKRVRDVPNRVWVRHADFAAGAFGGAPYGATKRAMGA